MANFQVYPTNLANPGRIGTIRMTLNIIFVLMIITHARGFESIRIFGGEGDLAAPYVTVLHCYTITASLWTSSNMPLFNVKRAQLFKCHFMFSKSHASTVE